MPFGSTLRRTQGKLLSERLSDWQSKGGSIRVIETLNERYDRWMLSIEERGKTIQKEFFEPPKAWRLFFYEYEEALARGFNVITFIPESDRIENWLMSFFRSCWDLAKKNGCSFKVLLYDKGGELKELSSPI